MVLSKSFFNGWSRSFDLGGTVAKSRIREILNKSENDKLRGDWVNVGRDIQKSAGKWKSQELSRKR